MAKSGILLPNYDDGRFFVSPILGCTGACQYCYLALNDIHAPQRNMISTSNLLETAKQCEEFVFGRHGTIISVGAWGDIFPLNDTQLIEHSIDAIAYLLSWGNPVQIMSKNALKDNYVKKICNAVQYKGQLLYSTTVTTIQKWKGLEPNTSAPIERLKTCCAYHNYEIPTNVLLKPFIEGLTGVEIDDIARLLLNYHIDYCTVGIMYWDEAIRKKAINNPFLRAIIEDNCFKSSNHLDCNGDIILNSTDILGLLPYVKHLRELGINAFLKSSCVNSNILHKTNPSRYYFDKSAFCIKCGNCNPQ